MKELIVILGGGESGVGAALLGKREGYEVFVSDFGIIKDNYKKILINNNIPFEEEGHKIESFNRAFLVIKSPGVPGEAPILRYLIRHQIPFISEIEFANRFYDGTIIAITGSNGKTTTSGLIFHLLNEAKKNVGIAGNIGNSFAAEITNKAHKDIMVLEISNFQLDDMVDFNPKIAVLLNITPDHLDRYEFDFYKYLHAKFQIINNQTSSDYFIYNANDVEIVNKLPEYIKNQQLIPIDKSMYLSGLKSNDELPNFETKLLGEHNLFNAQVAIQVARIMGLDESEIRDGLATFTAVEHRLEWVRNYKNVDYINDSKATNIDAVYYALQAIQNDIIWIAGGIDKGNDYTLIEDFVNDKVKALICLGKDSSKLLKAFSSQVKIIEETQSMEEAVQLASSYAENNDVVLLSPACSSFDLFENYGARGVYFKKYVMDL